MMQKTFFGVLALGILVSPGCTVTEIMTAEETELVVATVPKEESQLLDIGVIEFDPGIPENNDPDETRVYNEIRNAESRYLAYHLKTTMQGTGQWGAVRVLPSSEAFSDILINGRIKKSDGEFIEVEVAVSDTSGQHWFTRTYKTQTGTSSYSERRDRRLDPYQKIFNDIANDVKAHADTLAPERVERLQQISELKFFADMSPLTYGEHLIVDEDGLVSVQRLPADNDPTVDRLRQIRERDRLVVDMLNEHYANFYYGISIPYHSYRKASREEAINYRQVQRSARLQTIMGIIVVAGSLAIDTNDSSYSRSQMKRGIQNVGIAQGLSSIMSGFTRNSEASIHIEAIEELAESFGSEAAPMVVNIEGQSRRLTGTAAAQYESWRKLLRDIYEAESGFTEEIDVGVPVRAPEPTG